MKKKILFITGTRADFGKLKPLMQRLQMNSNFEVSVFVTGMHMLSRYGSTWEEVRKAGFDPVYKFVNQNTNDGMDHVLAKTVNGLSDYITEFKPDLMVVHGDRVETMAGAIVGAFNNILVAHVEGGEVSGTIDESIRHSVSKLAQLHFVSNEEAKRRLLQLGEVEDKIFIIGSPDIDVMNSSGLPSIEEVKRYYGFNYDKYAILLCHPVTSELNSLRGQIQELIEGVLASNKNYLVIFPNNDPGSNIILGEYERCLSDLKRVKVFPSMRFEYFLSALKNCEFIIGNSSAGIREAPHFGVPAINLGSRQHSRGQCHLIENIDFSAKKILELIKNIENINRTPISLFGDGNSAEEFSDILSSKDFWIKGTQKYFIDR